MANGAKAPLTVRIDADILQRTRDFEALGLIDIPQTVEEAFRARLTTLAPLEAEVKAIREKAAKLSGRK